MQSQSNSEFSLFGFLVTLITPCYNLPLQGFFKLPLAYTFILYHPFLLYLYLRSYPPSPNKTIPPYNIAMHAKSIATQIPDFCL